jgi:dihydropteroate synthase
VSLAATAMAVERGAHVVRTHDVAETLDAVRIGDAFQRDLLSDSGRDIEEIDVTNVGELDRHVTAVGGERPAVSRAFRLSGLSARERDTLDRAADRAGLTVVGDTDAILVGTPAAFRVAAESLDESSVTDSLTEIANRVQ